MTHQKSFGEILKTLREDKLLTLREVAEALNIDTSMLGKIEKNSRRPTKILIKKVAIYFKVDVKDLMIAFISDMVVSQIMDTEVFANEVLKVAEKKVKYIKTKENFDK